MQHVFYVLVLLTMLYEASYLTMPVNTWRIRKSFQHYRKQYSKHKFFLLYKLLAILALLVATTGLFSSQWMLFCVYFLWGFLVLPVYKFGKSKAWAAFVAIDGLFCSSLLFFILINKYHLHYSMKEIFNYLL